MKKLITTLSIITAFLTATTTLKAHEGHDHDAPKTVTAPKGGTIKYIDGLYAESVSKGTHLIIYFYDEDMKPLEASKLSVTMEAEIPRKKQKENLKITIKDNTAEAQFDAKGAHRYILHLTVKVPATKDTDTVSFNIEPKK